MLVKFENEGMIAFMLHKKQTVIDSGNGSVTFESEKTGKEWRQAYAMSEFSEFNANLFKAKMLKKGNT